MIKMDDGSVASWDSHPIDELAAFGVAPGNRIVAFLTSEDLEKGEIVEFKGVKWQVMIEPAEVAGLRVVGLQPLKSVLAEL